MNLHASLFFLFSLLKGKSRERERNPNGRPSSARPWQLNNAVVCFSPRFLGTHRPVIYTHCIYPVFPLSLKARQSCWSIEAKDKKKKRKEGSKRISSSFFLGRCTFFFCCFFEFSLSTVGYTYSFLSSSLFLPIFRLLFGIPSSFGSLVASLLLRLPFSIFFFFADCCLSSLYWVGLLVEFLYNKRGKRRSLCGQSQKSCAQVGHKIPQVFRPIVSMLA